MTEKSKDITFCGDIDKGFLKRAQLNINPDGPDIVRVEGAEYPLIGIPRQDVIKAMEQTKPILLSAVKMFHARMHNKFLPYKKLCPQVKSIHDAFNKLINWEQPWDKFHRELWGMVRDIVCFILHDDFPYRWRAIALLRELRTIDFSNGDNWWIKHQGDWNYDPNR